MCIILQDLCKSIKPDRGAFPFAFLIDEMMVRLVAAEIRSPLRVSTKSFPLLPKNDIWRERLRTDLVFKEGDE